MNALTRRRLHRAKLCKQTGKRKYASSLDVLLDNAYNAHRIRAYECPACGCWHGTRLYA